jgi:glycosyltransferase 2 family protein
MSERFRPGRPRWRHVAVAVGLVVVAAALLSWLAPNVSPFRAAFAAVSWPWVAAALGLNLLSVLVRSLAWRTVIDQALPPPRPRYRSIFSAFAVGLLGNAVLPGRVGEVARVAVLSRHVPGNGGVWATLAGTAFAHRVLDLVAMGALIAYVLFAAHIPTWAVTSLLVFSAAAVALLTLGILGARPRERAIRDGMGAVRRLVAMGRNGLAVMRAPLPAGVAVILQTSGWAAQLTAVYAAMRAFQINEPLHAAALVLVLMNVAMIFPLWPGNVGLVQAAVALPLLGYGIDYAHGFAFGLGLQAIEASVGISLGLIFLAREGLSPATLRHIPYEAPPGERGPDRAEGAREDARAGVSG